MLLDEMGLKGGSDFVGCLEGVVDGQIPCGVVNHSASISGMDVSGYGVRIIIAG